MNTLRRRRRASRATELLESLEPRQLLSAAITAQVTSNTLYLTGNSSSSSIIVDQVSLAAGQFRVSRGDTNTTLNGGTAALVYSNVNAIIINTGGGNDTIVLNNACINTNLQITSSGNQIVALNSVNVGGNFTLNSNGANSSLSVNGGQINGNLAVNVGTGYSSSCGLWCCSSFTHADEILTLSAATVANNLTVTNASGQTTTDIEASTIGGSVSVTDGSNAYGSCDFNCRSNCKANSSSTSGDLFTMIASSVANNLTISNASDGNTADIESSTVNGTLSVNNVVGTSNQSCFSACCSQNIASAADSFTLLNTTVGLNLNINNISDGAFADVEGSSVGGAMAITNGVGSQNQGFTCCAGQTSADFGDYLTLIGTTVTGNLNVTNGSTYNSTNVQISVIAGDLNVSNGLNYMPKTSYNTCGHSSSSSTVYTNDIFSLFGTVVGGNLGVTNASGYTNTAIDSCAIGVNVTITDANGTAIFEMSGSAVGQNLVFSAGTGSTNVNVSSSIIGNNATIAVNQSATVVFDPSQVVNTLIIT